MAIQSSITELHGSIGNLTFYKRNDKYVVRTKKSSTRESYHSNPNMEIPKLYNQEFSEAASCGKLFRYAIHALTKNVKDTYMVTRFTSQIRKVMDTDSISSLGFRRIENGDVSLLKNFNFNKNCPLDQIFSGSYFTGIDRKTGIATIKIQPFDKITQLQVAPNSTHFRFTTVCLEVDFPNKNVRTKTQQSSQFIPYDDKPIYTVLEHNFTPNSTLPVFIVLSIEFFQEVNGKMTHFLNREFNPRTIIEADKV